jgi:hypothetical protein
MLKGYTALLSHPVDSFLVIVEGRHQARTILLGPGQKKITSGALLLRNMMTTQNFEVTLDILPRTRAPSGQRAAIFSIGVDKVKGGGAVMNMPALFFDPGTTRLRAIMARPGSDQDLECALPAKQQLPLNKASTVNVRLWGGTLVLMASSEEGEPGRKKESGFRGKYTATKGVNAWLCRQDEHPADADVSNIIYQPLPQAFFAAGNSDVKGVYVQVGEMWHGSSAMASGRSGALYKNIEKDIWVHYGELNRTPCWQMRNVDPRAVDPSSSSSEESVLYSHDLQGVENMSVPLGNWQRSRGKPPAPRLYSQVEAITVAEGGDPRMDGIYVEVDRHSYGHESKAALFSNILGTSFVHFGWDDGKKKPRWEVRCEDPRSLPRKWSEADSGKALLAFNDGPEADSRTGPPMQGWKCQEGIKGSPPVCRQQSQASGWRSSQGLEGFWNMKYRDDNKTVMSIRVDGYLEVSKQIMPRSRGCTLLKPHQSNEGWMDRAEHHDDDAYELLRVKTTNPDIILSRICSSQERDRVTLEGDGHRIKNWTLIAAQSRRLTEPSQVVSDFMTYTEFELWVDLTPHKVSNKLTNILRLTSTRNDKGNVGDRIPALFFHPGTTRLEVSMGQPDHPTASYVVAKVEDALPLQRTSRVVVRLSGSELTVCVNGKEVAHANNYHTKAPGVHNVTVWAPDNFHEAADCTMSNLLYLPLSAAPLAIA